MHCDCALGMGMQVCSALVHTCMCEVALDIRCGHMCR